MLLFISRSRWVLLFAIVFWTVLGVGYGSAHIGTRNAYKLYLGQTLRLEGTLKEDVSKASTGSASIQMSNITINSVTQPGVVLVMARSPPIVKRGDHIVVQGSLKDGFGSFPAVLTNASVLSVRAPPVPDTGREIRDWFASNVRKVIPETGASLGIGFLTGQKTDLPESLFEALKIVGLTHIIVASGYNLTILVRLARRLFSRVSKYLSALTSIAMVICFVAVTGMTPSMSRAGIVSILSILAWYYGHEFHPLILLPLVAAITVAVEPSYVWGDLGWELSFAAFGGVMILGPLLQTYFFGNAQPGFLRSLVGETIAAHLATVPLIALSFGTFSTVSILANLLVVPLVPLAMLVTFVAGVWGAVGIGLKMLIGTPATWLLGYMTNTAQYLSEFDWAQVEVNWNSWVWLVYVMVLAGACFWMWHATGHNFRGGDNLR